MRCRITGVPLMLSTPSFIWMPVARQPDDALDEIDRGIARLLEDDHVAALRRPEEDPARTGMSGSPSGSE